MRVWHRNPPLTRLRAHFEADAELCQFWSAHRAIMAVPDALDREVLHCFAQLLWHNLPMCPLILGYLQENLSDPDLAWRVGELQYQALFLAGGGRLLSAPDQRLVTNIFNPSRRVPIAKRTKATHESNAPAADPATGGRHARASVTAQTGEAAPAAGIEAEIARAFEGVLPDAERK